jgi:hypothetical protein
VFHLIHESIANELAADRARHVRDDRRRFEAAHRRQVERVRASVERLPRTRPGIAREV